MLENYGNLIECAGSDRIVRVEAFANCEPVSIFDDEKTLKKGIFKTRKMSQAEKVAVYQKAKGVGYIFKISSRSVRNNGLLNGLDGLYYVQVFTNLGKVNNNECSCCDCFLNGDGKLIGRSKQYWDTMKGHEMHMQEMFWWLNDNKSNCYDVIKKIYSYIARTVAQNTIMECGQFKEEEFETAKAVPAQIFVANPDFAGEVLTEVEKALSKELDRRKERGQKTTPVICAGARIGRCLKEIFKQKIEEGRQWANGADNSSFSNESLVEDGLDDNDIEEIETIHSDEHAYDCDDETTGFPEGTFDAEELKKIAQNSRNK